MKNFFKNLFAIKEDRISTLIVVFIAMSTIVSIIYFKYHILESNMANVMVTFILTIGGVNGVSKISELINASKTIINDSETTDANNQSDQSQG